MFTNKKQECIPVGCVPSNAVAVWWGDVCLGGCLSGGCLHWEGCVCLGRGVSAQGVYTSPSVDRNLDTRLWKHYLSATTVADGNNLIWCQCFAVFQIFVDTKRSREAELEDILRTTNVYGTKVSTYHVIRVLITWSEYLPRVVTVPSVCSEFHSSVGPKFCAHSFWSWRCEIVLTNRSFPIKSVASTRKKTNPNLDSRVFLNEFFGT